MDGDDEVRKSRSLGQSKEQKEGCKLLVPDLCCVQCSHVAVYICIREAQTERDNKGGEGGDGRRGTVSSTNAGQRFKIVSDVDLKFIVHVPAQACSQVHIYMSHVLVSRSETRGISC